MDKEGKSDASVGTDRLSVVIPSSRHAKVSAIPTENSFSSIGVLQIDVWITRFVVARAFLETLMSAIGVASLVGVSDHDHFLEIDSHNFRIESYRIESLLSRTVVSSQPLR
jgi:hypothetical protein